MRVEYTTFTGFREDVKNTILKNSILEPGFFVFLEYLIIAQLVLFFFTIISILYVIFKYSKLGVKIRSIYSVDLEYDKGLYPFRQGLAFMLLYYYLVTYSILFPRLFVIGVYRPIKSTLLDIKFWTLSTYEQFINLISSIW